MAFRIIFIVSIERSIRPIRNNEESAYVIEMEEPVVKKNITSPIKTPSSLRSPIKLISSSSIEDIPPPSYEEWLQMSTGQISSNM